MQGKILGQGIISGNNGERYTFEYQDISNANNASMESLIGSQVDFEIHNQQAKSIFIVKQNLLTHDSTPGLLAIGITLLFGPFGAFFVWWLIAKWSVTKSLLYTAAFFIAIIISSFLCAFVIGFILLPIVWIANIVYAYKAVTQKI